MSWAAHNPELYDELIFKEMVRRGYANEEDDIEETVQNFVDDPRFTDVAIQADADYWSSRIDDAMDRMKEKGL